MVGVAWSSCQLLTKAPTSSGKPNTSNLIQGFSLCGCLTEVCGKWSSCTLRSGPTSQRLRNQGALLFSYFGKFSGCFWTWFKRLTPCRRTKRSSSQIKTQVTKSPFSPLSNLHPRHNPGPLQCWSWENRHLPGSVQALARLHQPQHQGARRLPHRA